MKLFIVRGKTLLLAGAVLVLAAAAAVSIAMLSNAVVSASVSGRLIPIYGVDRQDKTVSLTFDAAWGNVIIRIIYHTECSGAHFVHHTILI